MTRLMMTLLLVCTCSLSLMAQEPPAQTPPVQNPNDAGQQPAPTHPAATTYSNGYEVRLKIHKYASWATIPLFATELALGQSLYNTPETGAKRTAHGIVGAGIVGLFGANSVTGVWNLWESRHDTEGRKMRILHSVLMLAADGGFVATAATGPHMRHGIITNPSDKSLHRDIAIASIGTGTVGYLLMLLKGR